MNLVWQLLILSIYRPVGSDAMRSAVGATLESEARNSVVDPFRLGCRTLLVELEVEVLLSPLMDKVAMPLDLRLGSIPLKE